MKKNDKKVVKAMNIANKLLDMLDICIVSPLHSRVTDEGGHLTREEIGNIITVGKMLKDVAQFADDDTNDDLSNMTDEELLAQLQAQTEESEEDESDEGNQGG